MTVLLQGPVLVCPTCDHREPAGPFNPEIGLMYQGRFHSCKGLKGVIAPLVPEGLACKTEKVDREDYEGGELVQRDDDGRPVMAVHMTADNTEHHIVLPPTARASSE